MANWKQAPFINGQGEAVATNKGWENPRTGEVLACHAGLADKLDAEAPKKAKPAASKTNWKPMQKKPMVSIWIRERPKQHW